MSHHSISATDLRRNFQGNLLDVVKGDHLTITSYGRPVAVMVPVEWYERVVDYLKSVDRND